MDSKQQCFLGFDELKISCFIGVLPEEKLKAQEIRVSLEVGIDCIKNDEIALTIDYRLIASLCEEVAKSKHYGLLETLAQEMVERLSQAFSFHSVKLKIEKPGALASARTAYVSIQRPAL